MSPAFNYIQIVYLCYLAETICMYDKRYFFLLFHFESFVKKSLALSKDKQGYNSRLRTRFKNYDEDMFK